MSKAKDYTCDIDGKKYIYARYDKDKKEGIYFIKPGSFQLEHGIHNEIKLEGFNGLPQGLSTTGNGLGVPLGNFLPELLDSQITGKVKLIISKAGPTQIKKYANANYHLTIKHSDLMRIRDGLKELVTEKNERSRAYAADRLNVLLPSHITPISNVETLTSFATDKLAKIIRSEDNIVAKLSKNDVEAVVELHAAILSAKLDQAPKDLKVLSKGKAASERIYLERVVADFESKLANTTHDENSWQVFLRDSILLFNTSYVHVLEKLSVALGGKYPDFMLVDVYDYVDIYEIKKPNTTLLRHDSSRDNYYWSPEMSKAIVQTEKYIHMLDRNSAEFVTSVKDKEGIDIRAIRPRGFIIAGVSAELDSPKKLNDFRILVSALKNVDVILYDDFLNSLKNLLDRLSD